MAANRYDKPVSYDYVDQYVPIPFQELVTLGKHYAEERKAAEKQLSDYIRNANEFQSLISKDVDNYYKIAMNDNIKDMINQAAYNPSVMKSAAWRASLAGAINNVDYASLSRLKQSAVQADLYDKVYKQLAAQGKMPPGWEPDYFSNYDTLASGQIFNETPMPYQTINDMVHPYVNDLKDSYLGTKGGYDWYGVDEKTVYDQVNRNMSEILARPDAQRYIQMMGTDNFMNAVYTAAEEKVRMKPEANPYAYLESRARLSGAGSSASDTNVDRIAQIQAGASKRTSDYMNYISSSTLGKPLAQLNDEELQQVMLVAQMSAKDPKVRKQLAVQLDWGEYLNYQDPSGSIRTSITDKDGKTKKGEDNLEEYMFRNTDVVFTTDGQELGDIPISYINGRQVSDDDRTINIGNILQLITDSAFKGNGTANMYNGNINNPLDGVSNYMIANGKLIVPEEILEGAIEAAYPEEAGDLFDMFVDGIKDPQTGRRVHQIATKYKGKDSYLYGHEDLYEINIGRAFGNDAATNARFNEDRMKAAMGTSTVAKNQLNVLGSSWQEAGNTEFE